MDDEGKLIAHVILEIDFGQVLEYVVDVIWILKEACTWRSVLDMSKPPYGAFRAVFQLTL